MRGTAYDLVVVGGGVMGCAAALRCAAGGMKTAVVEKDALGSGASGVNAGTLSLQIKRAALMQYAIRGLAIWKDAGTAVGYHRTGGYTLAFSAREASLLEERVTSKRAAGAPVSMISLQALRRQEPGLSDRVVAASTCPEDGFADSSLTGHYYRKLLSVADVAVYEHTPVTGIVPVADGYELVTSQGILTARRILLAGGAWLNTLLPMLETSLPVAVRVNTVSVLERGPAIVRSVIGHATGLLTLKQKPNGSVLIGGGWQGSGSPEVGRGSVVAASLLTNLRLARFAVPGLADRRLLRSWTGFEAHVPDYYPLAGRLPGHDNAFVLGCVRGGYTIGPYIAHLMGDLILDKEPELPLFNPGRFNSEPIHSDQPQGHP